MSAPSSSSSIDLTGLTDAQRTVATTLDGPLFVEAGAGSGKTFTLTQRIVWALSPGSGADGGPFITSLDQVLVITFTKAAAREIRERTRLMLRRAGMVEQALSVDDAWISTIHGMCSRILHRHALDLGLDPEFTVLEQSDQDTLFQLALDDVMGEARDDGSAKALIDEYGFGNISYTGNYSGLIRHVKNLLEAVKKVPGGLDALEWVSEADARACLDDAMCNLLMRYEELGACKLTSTAKDKVEPALEALRSWDTLAPGARTAEAASAILKKVAAPNPSNAIEDVLPEAKRALALAKTEAELCRVAPLAPQLIDLARRVDARYKDLKQTRAVLDNDDLVSKALVAVRDVPEVRSDLAGRFRLVMVDEFQDTDDAQLELVELLAGGEDGALCTVGDAQQSIYRFRGADVEVFRKRRGSVGDTSTVSLDMNFRSHADVLAFVRHVGTSVISGFMDLKACPTRKDAYHARELPRIDVEIAGGVNTATVVPAVLAAQVADALVSYRDAGERPGDMALLLGRTTNADYYIDAIRARGMECVVTGGSTFSRAREVKVVCALLHVLANPSDTESGLFPVLASEMFGLDANDFCDLGTRTQEKLDAPTKRKLSKGLFSQEFYGDLEPSARLVRAQEVLTHALKEVCHRPVADVVEETIRDSGWLSRLEGEGATGRAKAANVLAAERYVRDLTEEMGLGAARAATEFDRWLTAAKVGPGSLSGEDDEEGPGTVRVMTIHASKGLEFPIVAVAECWNEPRGEGGPHIAEPKSQTPLLVMCPKATPADLGGISTDGVAADLAHGRVTSLSSTLAYARECDKAGEAEEKTRLLYVAMTRAREALVLAVDGRCTSRKGVSSQLARSVLSALTGKEELPDVGVHELEYGGSLPARLRMVSLSKVTKDETTSWIADSAGTLPGVDGELPEEVEKIVRLGTPEEGSAQSQGLEPFALYELEQPTRATQGSWRSREGIWSYSSAHAAEEAKAETANSHASAKLEIRTEETEAKPDASDPDHATDLGSAFHELAQSMIETGYAPTEAHLKAEVAQWRLSPAGEQRLRAALARWEHSSIRAEALSHAELRAEAPFFCEMSSTYGEYLEGAIDLLCTDPGSRDALVVDYKTGDAALTPQEVYEHHAMQAMLYARVLLSQGWKHVECAFVCVERDDPAHPGEPLVARYEFSG